MKYVKSYYSVSKSNTLNVLFFDYNKATTHHIPLGHYFRLGNRCVVFPVFVFPVLTDHHCYIKMLLDAGLLLDMNRNNIEHYLL